MSESSLKRRLRRGLWSPDEDQRLRDCVTKARHCRWSDVPKQAGLQRCGKSCRLRWINYLNPEVNHSKFSPEEERLILEAHKIVGNRWSQIAALLPRRTDNQVKNHWNSKIRKGRESQPSESGESIVISDGSWTTSCFILDFPQTNTFEVTSSDSSSSSSSFGKDVLQPLDDRAITHFVNDETFWDTLSKN